ncbi:CHAT domain-containing protein [Paraliomyxa miuraensis]|uniref:CHAT domain-containing protein n=1 Tax=Paraliomyxa miuraensis TaxID=376150 RepID=UPI002257C905|nr:CHAT domain-containing protein [Paraliomyxa miuraensis]MCX4240593.1 CHAT domain-containing protein [Paraliomyxa miuraensis]
MRNRHLVLLASLAISAIVALSCRITTMTPARPSAVSGCDFVRTESGGLQCLLPAPAEGHELVLWFQGQELLDPEVTLRGWRSWSLPVDREFVGVGTRLVVRVGHPGTLEITGAVVEPSTGLTTQGTWAVELEQRPTTPRLDAIARRWRTTPADAEALLEDLEVPAIMASRWQAAEAWALRGEILRRTATPVEALDAFERAMQVAGPDELSLRCRLTITIAELHLVDREDFEAADRILYESECHALGLVHGAPEAMLQGALAFREGHLDQSIAHFERAAEGAHRLRLPQVGLAAAGQLAVAQARAQRFESAARTLARARALAEELEVDCEDRLALAGHELLIATEQGHGREAAVAQAMRGLETIPNDCVTSASAHALTVLGIAYAMQQAGRIDEAQRWLDGLDDRTLHPQQRMYRASIAADVAVARGDRGRATVEIDRLSELVDRHPHESNPELEVQREYVRGTIAAAENRLEWASWHLGRAMRMQEDRLRLVPLGLSASRVSAREADPGRALVELQRRQGNDEAALCTARLLRNRAGRMLLDAARLYAEDRSRYERLVDRVHDAEQAFEDAEAMGSDATLDRAKAELLAAQRALVESLGQAAGLHDYSPSSLCAALPEPEPGELALLFHQDPRGRWWLFEWSHAEPVRIHDVGPLDPSPTDEPRQVVERWLHPALDRLEHASRIRLLTEGPTNGIVFEALPWEDGTLEQRFAVTWGLDLPRRPELAPSPDQGVRPVVVYTDYYHEFDRDQPRANAMIESIERVWGRETPVLPVLVEGSSTRDLERLSGGAAPLIVIGHNSAVDELEIDNPECPTPRSSRERGEHGRTLDPRLDRDPKRPTPGLWINQTSMGLGTLLTLEPPRVAILESCATGPVDELSLDGTVGLGHVLIAAGTRQVLVTRRKVCPASAFDFLRALVEAAAGEPLDLPALLRAARHADSDHVHRVLVP